MSRRPSPRAFTLIELLTVITIIGILVSITFGVTRGVKQRAAVQQARTELAVVSQSLEDYRRLYSDYPQLTIEDTKDAQKEVQLLKALIGLRGPTNDSVIKGKTFLDTANFSVATVNAPEIQIDPYDAAANGAVLIDPWDRPYHYYYFNEANRRGYLLYSSGPDGEDIAPTGLKQLNETSPENTDNIYANR